MKKLKPKNYIKRMKAISSRELYAGLMDYGLFSDRLPSIFDSNHLSSYLKRGAVKHDDAYYECMSFEVKKDSIGTRNFQIPNPIPYSYLCTTLANNWEKITEIFNANSMNWDWCVSRIHIRKRKASGSLFEMNYRSLAYDDDPENELLVGSKFIVRTDISSCFPSIYTHSIPWALDGRKEAKCKSSSQGKSLGDQIDRACQFINSHETHGLPVGPHASSVISEILLTTVDKVLIEKGYRFIRNIDDYSCYVASSEKGERFIADLTQELKKYRLQINTKKTAIVSSFDGSKKWTLEIDSFVRRLVARKVFDYKDCQEAISLLRGLSHSNGSYAPYKYFLSCLANKLESIARVTESAANLLVTEYFAQAYWNSYLAPIICDRFYRPDSPLFQLASSWCSHSDLENLFAKYHHDGDCYGVTAILASAASFGIHISSDSEDKLFSLSEQFNDAILNATAFAYARLNRLSVVDQYHKKALTQLNGKGLYGDQWLFVYEACTSEEINNAEAPEALKKLKLAGYTFINLLKKVVIIDCHN